ncbi:DUF3368 domain-containing protein [Tundrisphaera sp. TA3]|uniref:DUF3368 domain-containing protein n=1 Tax=Tundrisphaera sp. TA3 TaxID=3435775 RepID=UPI003EB77FB6
MIVVSDTTPLNYLILIGEQEVLARLFGQVIIPPAVLEEMRREKAPEPVRAWAKNLPDWVTVRAPVQILPGLTAKLHEGEIHAISLAAELNAATGPRLDWILIDDWDARKAARALKFPLLGTINILEEAAVRGFLDIQEAATRLRSTNYRATADQYQAAIDNVQSRRAEQEQATEMRP